MTSREYGAAHRIACYYLAPWRSHPDFEDLAAEVVLEGWRKWQRDAGRYTLRTYLKTAARYKPVEWERSSRSGNLVDGYHQVRFKLESYDDLLAGWEDSAAALPIEPLEPDFSPALIQRLALGARLATLPAREQILVRLTQEQELTAREAGARVGATKSAVVQAVRKALLRLRAEMETE